MTRHDLQHTRYDDGDNDASAGYPDRWPLSRTSSVRWSDTAAPTTTPRRRYDIQQGAPSTPIRKRASLTSQPPANQGRDRAGKTTKNTEALPRRWRPHWLLVVGLAMLVMLAGYVAITSLFSWVTGIENHWQYGSPPVYQCDAIVGHHDSPTHPSHFIALNYQGQIEVIEFPGGDVTHAKIYPGLAIIGPDAANTPVTISFKDLQGDGKVDMIVTVGNSHTIFLNENGEFIKEN